MLKETSFLLPKIYELNFLPTKKDRTKPLAILGYSPKIDETKNKISSIKYKKWTNLRKISNDFEFPCEDEYKIPRPISRAFFKLCEILVDHEIDANCNTLHLAESPGGFIESCLYYKNKLYKEAKTLHTFSLCEKKDEVDVPVYSEKISKNKNVMILSNKENKGDLYDPKNIEFLIVFLKSKQIKFITCDGGFTEKNDFSAKEHLHHKLIFNQIVTSLFVLENRGTLVIKFFDVFTELSFDFIYILAYLFEKVYVCKPHTSRPTNSERYITCKFFNKAKFSKISQKLKTLCVSGIENYSSVVHKGTIRNEFMRKFKEVNVLLSEYQMTSIENILNIYTLNLRFSRKKTENLNKWVKKYIEY